MKRVILGLMAAGLLTSQAMAKDPLVGEYEYRAGKNDGSYVVIHEPKNGIYPIDISASFMDGNRICEFEGAMKYNKSKKYYEIIHREEGDSYKVSLAEVGNKTIKLDYVTDNIGDYCGGGASFNGDTLKKIK